MYTCACTPIYTYTSINIHIWIYICTHKHIYTCTRAYLRIHIHLRLQIHIHMRTCVGIHMRTYLHGRANQNTDTQSQQHFTKVMPSVLVPPSPRSLVQISQRPRLYSTPAVERLGWSAMLFLGALAARA